MNTWIKTETIQTRWYAIGYSSANCIYVVAWSADRADATVYVDGVLKWESAATKGWAEFGSLSIALDFYKKKKGERL